MTWLPVGPGPSRRALLAGLLGVGAVAACSPPGPATDPAAQSSSTTADPALTWGPSRAQLAQATELVSGWPAEKLAGQVLILSYDGAEPSAAAAAVAAVHAAGVILMGPNIVSAEQVSATAGAVQQALTADGRDFPAVITVDQEGGTVARLGGVIPATPTFSSAGAAIAGDASDGAAAVAEAARATGGLLRALGFTWVFAPDADVTIGPDDPTIGSRSAGDTSELVGKTVTAAIGGYREAGIVSSAKHFPGHGSVTADSHKTLPVQAASLETLRRRDLPPFRAATVAGVPVIMMSHIAVDAIEAGVPCSLSAKAYAALRQETGFAGVVCTDAMNMEAVAATYGPGRAAASAVIAGADAVLMPADSAAAHQAILSAVQDGSLTRDRLVEAAARVVALQLWQQAQAAPPATDPATSTLVTASAALSAAAITQVSGTCGDGPIVEGVILSGGTTQDRALLASAAKDAGLQVGSGSTVFLATPGGRGSADLVVALDTPYVLARCTARQASYALYGRTPGAFAALAAVLAGTARPRGALPVTVESLSSTPCTNQ